ncbi:unnamed protein product [Pleuronectes platessa]|uniref:polynucleotide adenylyltransferase n=1 Tax=Pleuronectes platessa TaxID=8262 RepID=A0A9N7U607_PLEPL|nr:unnamed protein product [Pleuronectes platessa]
MSETKTSQRFHSLNAEQVEVLHQVLSEVVPIHGRGNFPTLELRPRDIIIAVRTRLQKQGITVRDVRLNGSTASHVLVRDNGTSYKDLDIIFGVELPSQEEFQVIKESVLGCLLDCLPAGVNRERISSSTMKEAYVQKMVKVFNDNDRWSLISLSNNSGKNLELKFVSVLRRQFEFSVDSFQIILDRLLESYMQQESRQRNNRVELKEQERQSKASHSPLKEVTPPETERPAGGESSSKEGDQVSQTQQKDEVHEKESQTDLLQQTQNSNQTTQSKVEEDEKDKKPAELKEMSQHRETDISDQTSSNPLSETSEKTETPAQTEPTDEPELLDKTKRSTQVEESAQTQTGDSPQPAQSNHKELPVQKEPSDHTNSPEEQIDLTEQIGQSELPKASNNRQAEVEESHTTERTDQSDFFESFSEDQRNNEKDNAEHVSAPVTDTSPDAKEETQSADEGIVETETGEQIQLERKNGSETYEETEEVSAPEAKNIEDTQGIDCSCSFSSESLTFHNTQDTTEIQSTDNSEKSPNVLDADNPTDTPVFPSLSSDIKTSSSPPSCKPSERLSHMVVLKHSSPKPPRRMCRKVTHSPYPTHVSESEPITVFCLDLIPCASPELEVALNPESTAPSSDAPTTTSTGISVKTNPEPESIPSTNLPSNLEPTLAPDAAPDITATAVELTSLPQELPSLPQPVAEGSYETCIQSLEETPSTHEAFDEQSQSSPGETVSTPSQSEPLDSEDGSVSHTDASTSGSQEPAHTSEVELSNEDENRETQKSDPNQPNNNPQEIALTPVSCLTPPVLSLSPPCFTTLPLSLSSTPCLSPPPPLPSVVSLTTSSSSTPLSFSPTSSCLSSPPYLTPPMLSLSPPPLCLTPPSPCLSPPLLCLTPPVESEDLVPQVSPDTEPLILNTDSEEQIKESSPQPQVSLLQLEDKKEDDYISPLPGVAEPVSFPITIASSTSPVLPHSQSGSPGESSHPKAEEASSLVPEIREAPELTADMPEQSNALWVSDLVPAVEVLAESMYGDFKAAMDHLHYRLIATRNPEEIRGGGLLKYSNLLVRDYRPASETQIKTLERYMCSRFFIDFPDVQEQQRKILSYLKNHFIGEERSKYQYLMTLRRVVDDSTVCLMGHERRQTLNMITVLALKVLGEQNIIPNTDHVTCFYQPAPYLAEHSAPYLAEPSYCSYYIPQGGSTLLYQPYPLHLHTQTGLV